MSFQEKDFIKRMIERLALFVASIAARRGEVAAEVLLDEVAREKADLIGLPMVTLDVLSVDSVKALLGSTEAIGAYRSLVELEAELLADAGRMVEASAARERAAAL